MRLACACCARAHSLARLPFKARRTFVIHCPHALLVAAVKAAGLVDALSGDGPLTVFAPTDEAFAKLPAGTVENLLKPENKDQLVAVLTYHVVKGDMPAAKVLKQKSLKTLQGGSIAVSTDDKGAMVNASRILKTDIGCSNGVVHVIDTVLLPTK